MKKDMQDERSIEDDFEVSTLADPTKEASSHKSDKASKKRASRTKWLIVLAVILVIVLLLVLLVAPFFQAYKGSYVEVPFITRQGTYTVPPMPTSDIHEISEEEWQKIMEEQENENTDAPTAETEAPIATTPGVTTPKVTAVPKEKNEYGIYKVDQINKDVQNILVLGTDSLNVNSLAGRSDVMLVVSINKKKGTVKLVSLLRDLYVPIDGHDWNRLNAAYSFGGISLCINTINSIFNLDIQRFMLVNFEGTKKIVDLCGGVDVALTDREYEVVSYSNPTYLGNGVYHLNGEGALSFMRIRNITTTNGSGDFGRTARQRIVITTLYQQILHDRSVNVYDLVRESFGMIKTNLSLNELLDLATDFVSLGDDLQIVSDRIPQNGMYGYAMAGKKAVTTFNREKNVKYLHDLLYGA